MPGKHAKDSTQQEFCSAQIIFTDVDGKKYTVDFPKIAAPVVFETIYEEEPKILFNPGYYSSPITQIEKVIFTIPNPLANSNGMCYTMKIDEPE